MTTEIKNAINRASSCSFPCDLWWMDEKTVDYIAIAVKNGWALRISHTQVQWTDKGIKEIK